LATFADQR